MLSGHGRPTAPTSGSVTAAASLPTRRASLRSWSKALCLATPASHAPGLAGTPSAGHFSTASAHASCAASSAKSRSPLSLAATATAIRQCSRKTSSYVSVSSPPSSR